MLAILLCAAFARAEDGSAARSTAEAPVVIAAVGDILLGRRVDNGIRKTKQSPFADLVPTFRSADLVLGNLECVLKGGGDLLAGQGFHLWMPPENAHFLSDAGFSCLSLANNHSMDFGAKGLTATLDALHAMGIATVGAGRTLEEANRAYRAMVRGRRISVLAFSSASPGGTGATKAAPGQSASHHPDVLSIVRSERPACDTLIVFLHWGWEMEEAPRPEQRAYAAQLIEAGADVLLGSHPHVLQGIETVRGRPVFYSLGNFVFDQKTPEEARDSIVAKILVRPGRTEVRIVPVVADASFAPRVVRGVDAERIFRRAIARSALVGTVARVVPPLHPLEPEERSVVSSAR